MLASGCKPSEFIFSNSRQYNSIFGNQSIIKKKQLFLEYENGFLWQDNQCQSGDIIISNNKLHDVDQIMEINPLPLESSLIEFCQKVNNRCYTSNISMSVDVNKILDKLEIMILE